MKKKKQETSSHENPLKAFCNFCGSTVGQISERTENRVNAVYDCPKCNVNYCDQCSYEIRFCIGIVGISGWSCVTLCFLLNDQKGGDQIEGF